MKVIFDKILGTFREERNVISTTKCTNQIFLKNLRGCGAPVNMPNGINVSEPIIFPTGASNGYVWTTDANGNGSWQPASGGTPEFLTFDVTIPHGEILTLYSNPKELIPAPGANKLIVPVSIVGYYYYNGVPYASNTDCYFRFGNSTYYPDGSVASIFLNIAETISIVNTLGLNKINDQQSSDWFDKNLNITVFDGNPTGGTAGNYIRIKGKYYIEDFN